MTLRRRIAAVAGLAVAVTVVIAAGAIYVGVGAQLRGELDRALRSRAQELVQSTDPDRDGDAACTADNRDGAFSAGARSDGDDARFGGAEGVAQLVCPDGRVLRQRGSTVVLPVPAGVRAIARAGSGSEVTDVHVGGVELRIVAVGRKGGGAVQVARPLAELHHELTRILLVLAVVAAAGVALAAALGALVARAALAPIARFIERTEAIGSATPSERIEVEGDDELARLARSFNTTLDALERSVEAQRHLVADASHELRTPIASLRANIQTLEDADRLPAADRAALRSDIVAELDELTALVGDVVELARGNRPGRALDDVRLDRIVAALAERARARAAGRVSIETELEDTIVSGEPDRIERAVSNLIDNAVKWSPPGGVVEVRLRDGTLSVRDHGPGFRPADLEHVFERFYRAEDARGLPGSGLGLAIVHQAAEAHGGSVSAANAPGGGGVLRIRFGP